MNSIIEEFNITLRYQVKVDTETGEMTTTCISRKIDKSNFEVTEAKKRTTKAKKEESSEPILTLEDNKYVLTQAAVDLLGAEADSKLDIKYEKQGKEIRPVIALDDTWGTHQGNRLTKSNTVVCRGAKNQELAKYGVEFLLIPHNEKDGIFILKNKNEDIEKALDDTIENKEEEIELPVDIDLQDLIDDKEEVTEIDSSLFKL